MLGLDHKMVKELFHFSLMLGKLSVDPNGPYPNPALMGASLGLNAITGGYVFNPQSGEWLNDTRSKQPIILRRTSCLITALFLSGRTFMPLCQPL